MGSVLAEALNSQDPTGRLHAEALGRTLSVGRRLKAEILTNIFVSFWGLRRKGEAFPHSRRQSRSV